MIWIKKNILAVCIIFIISNSLLMAQDSSNYLGQKSPGNIPEIFAPGIISLKNQYEFGISITDTGDELFFAVKLDTNWKAEIRYSKLENGVLQNPQRLELDESYSYNDPWVTGNGNRLYFISDRPMKSGDKSKDIDLWYVDKNLWEWSDPYRLDSSINSIKNEFYISISAKGAIYYSSNINTKENDIWNYDIYFFDQQTPKKLCDKINSEYFECDPFISSDETMLIFCSNRPGGIGEGDLYISFKKENGKWSNAKNLGGLINTENHEFCPYVTPDGEYFFYSSNGDIYWISCKYFSQFKLGNNYKSSLNKK